MNKSKYGLSYRAELKEPPSVEGDPWIFLNFYDQSLPDTVVRMSFETDNYDKKFEFAEKLTDVLNKISEIV